MDDQDAQFFLAVADACCVADLAGIEVEVEVVTVTGRRVTGVPTRPTPPRRPNEELVEIGHGRALLFDDDVVDLADVRRCTLIAPGWI